MAGQKRYTRKTIREAIKGSRGIKVAICARLECTRQTLDNYLKQYPDLAAAFAEERENIIDMAETQLLKAVNGGDMRAVLFVLETMGKDRGWSKRTEVTGANGTPLGLSPEVMQMMQMMGMEPSDVVRQFEEMIREQAGVSNG